MDLIGHGIWILDVYDIARALGCIIYRDPWLARSGHAKRATTTDTCQQFLGVGRLGSPSMHQPSGIWFAIHAVALCL